MCFFSRRHFGNMVWYGVLIFGLDLPEAAWPGWSCVSSPAPCWKSSCGGRAATRPEVSPTRRTENTFREHENIFIGHESDVFLGDICYSITLMKPHKGMLCTFCTEESNLCF